VAAVAVDEPGAPLTPGDVAGIAVTIPRLQVGAKPVVLRAWYTLAMVASPDCAYAKESLEAVQVAPVLPLAAAPLAQRNGIKAGTNLTAFFLPAGELATEQGPLALDDSFVDVLRATAVAPHLLDGYRMSRLSEDLLDRFREFWLRHVSGREISSTGTLGSARGCVLQEVSVLESSKRRHTVLMHFADGTDVVLYQDPRRKGANVQPVEIRQGRFNRTAVSAQCDEQLILRFENEDARDYTIRCPLLAENQRIPAGATTDILLQEQPSPATVELANLDAPRAPHLNISFRT
jgi:hypothetical protein